MNQIQIGLLTYRIMESMQLMYWLALWKHNLVSIK